MEFIILKGRSRIKRLAQASLTLSLIYPFQSLLPTTGSSSTPAIASRAPSSSTSLKASTPLLKQPTLEELYLTVNLNHQKETNPILILKDKQGNIWVNQNDLSTWNLQLSEISLLTYNNNRYINITKLPGVRWQFDEQNQSLTIVLPATSFRNNHIDLSHGSLMSFKRPDHWGGFLNYSLNDYRVDNSDQIGGIFDLNIFGPAGAGSSSYAFISNPEDRPSWVRLNTRWVYDQPEHIASWRFGDLNSDGGSWSGSVGFGGLQWASNFSTQPQFITFPLPGYRGPAIAPSVIDLYVNNIKTQQLQVTPGQFDITNVPLVDGQGNLRIVTTDILGRQQVFSSNFFLDTSILKPGLHEFSYEAGIIRQNLGLANYDYKDFLISATNAFSPNDLTRLEFHGETLSYEQAGGMAITRVLPSLASTLTGTAAVSNYSLLGGKKGGLASIRLQHKAQRFNFGLSYEITSHYFTDMGITPNQLSPRSVSQIFGGIDLQRYGSVGINYTRQLNREQESAELVSLTYSKNIFFKINFSATLMNSLHGENRGVSFFLLFTRILGEQTTASYSYNRYNTNIATNSWQLSRSLSTGPGWGYRLGYAKGTSETQAGTLNYQNNMGRYSIQYTEQDNQTFYQGSADGSIALLGGEIKASRLIDNSFALVSTSGFPHVKVYNNNGLTGTTDSKGILLIPNLLPYQTNKISISPTTLPLNTEIDTTQIMTTPFYRSGTWVKFGIRQIRSATLTLIQQPSGEIVPLGATIELLPKKETYFVGEQGETYLTHLKDSNAIEVSWDDQSCTASFLLPPASKTDVIPDLGKINCITKNSITHGTKKRPTVSLPNQPISAAAVVDPAKHLLAQDTKP